MTICVIGDPDDLTAAYIGWLADRRGLDPLVLAEHRLGLDWWFHIDPDGGGTLTAGEREMRLAEIDAAFVRFNPRPPIPEELALPEVARPVLTQERRYGLHWLLDRLPCPVVNRPYAGRGNSSKPYQMCRLEALGFDVPAWLVTNERGAASSFARSTRGGVVVKSCSGLRSHVRRADEALLDKLGDATAPVLLQRYIPGCDVRVHVVGNRTFASEIRSAAVDYRFDESPVEYRAASPPERIARSCVRAARSEGLELAGLDFRRTPDGNWWCLEMNPVPTFLPYEASTGHPLGDAILDLLVPAHARHVRSSPLQSIG